MQLIRDFLPTVQRSDEFTPWTKGAVSKDWRGLGSRKHLNDRGPRNVVVRLGGILGYLVELLLMGSLQCPRTCMRHGHNRQESR